MTSPADKITPAFLTEKMGREVHAVKFRDQEKMGGMSAEMVFLDVAMSNGEQIPMVLKTNPPGNGMKIAMGCAREALFYNEFAAKLADANVPVCYYAEGDMATGEMLILIECMENAVPAGTFCGAGNPNNWSVKDRLEAMCEGNPTAEQITKDAFQLYARLHAKFWQDPKLFAHDWVRASTWYQGIGMEGWNASQKQSADMWVALTKAQEEGTSPIKWDAHLVACINASVAKIEFSTFQDEIKTRPYTLVHGDCHPHNALWTSQRT